MAAIIGLDRAQLDALIAAHHSEQAPVYLANLNGPRQLVIAGSNAALAAVMSAALQDGASKAARLAMSVPSHCPLLAEAAQILCADMAAIAARSPSGIYLSASAARRLRDPAAIKLDLAMNMAQQVHWSTTLRLAWESGARLALEMPGSSTLTNLVNSQWSDGMALACDTGRPDVLIDLALREQSSLH
jgi:malonate decarboxylase epsilon subunit